MKQYVLGLYQKYSFLIGGFAVVPSVYMATGRLLLAVAGYSVGYAAMLLIDKITQ